MMIGLTLSLTPVLTSTIPMITVLGLCTGTCKLPLFSVKPKRIQFQLQWLSRHSHLHLCEHDNSVRG